VKQITVQKPLFCGSVGKKKIARESVITNQLQQSVHLYSEKLTLRIAQEFPEPLGFRNKLKQSDFKGF